nr:LOW QUALITY PROTEIN: ATP-binding cassette sub-family A member 3-like [Rhipicephalus microplus]
MHVAFEEPGEPALQAPQGANAAGDVKAGSPECATSEALHPGASPWRQLLMVLWKNIYIKRMQRHYTTTLLEIVLMVVLLLGIQDDAEVVEPLVRRGDTYFRPISTYTYWNTQPDMAQITQVYFAPVENRYLARLTHDAMADLRVVHLTGFATEKELVAAMRLQNGTPVHTVALLYTDVAPGDRDSVPVSLHVNFFGGRLPFDVRVNYLKRLLSQPEGPSKEERFPEVNTLLPIMGALQQRHLEYQSMRHNRTTSRMRPVHLQRFPYPTYIEHKDTKNYALVLTRFCVGMLVPFAVFVARLSEEKTSGMKEMLRVVGLNDCVYWVSHYISGFFMHLIIVTLMMLILCVKRNEDGRAFIQFSDPFLLFCILMCFCSSCLMHATLLSMIFASPHTAVAAAMLYWTFSCLMPFLALENAGGQGYHFIKRSHKLVTSVFPGMSLHWSFRVLERFEKFVPFGANWSNFASHAATPDNVTLAEIVFVGLMCDCLIGVVVWYLDNVMPIGPGIAKPLLYPFKMEYWLPSMTYLKEPLRSAKEVANFEPEPRDQCVAIDLFHVSKDYDGVEAVHDVSLRIFNNQITVLLGHNGAGKTTLLNMITGFTNSTSGNVLVGGYDVMTCTKDARESIAYCAQDNILFDDLTVEEHLVFFAVVKGTPYDSVRQEVVTLLNETGLIQYRSDLVDTLSLGQQRRLCAALAIVSKPKVIILDEPTANMDPEGRREMWELLLKIRRSCALFLTTQHLDEADVLADRILIIVNGRIRCAGSPTFLKQRFNTGYRMLIYKSPTCDVSRIEMLLRKYAPKVKLQSDSFNEVTFLLGHTPSTKRIINMFRDIEKQSRHLGIESLGLTVTSLEDVLIGVAEEHHVHSHKLTETIKQHDASMIETKGTLVNVMASTVSSNPGCARRMWAVFCKRATCVSRQLKIPLFSWLLPMMLLWLLFTFEDVALYRNAIVAEHVGNTLSYSFVELVGKANGFAQVREDGVFYVDYILPLIRPGVTTVEVILPDENVDEWLLQLAKDDLRHYVFMTHFGVQLLEQGRTVLWYNGEIQHMALLVLTLFNNGRLHFITGKTDVLFSFEVTVLDSANVGGEGEHGESHGAYRELLPQILRSIFLPMVSSLMCSNFVLFPITERALQVKHLHIITGIGPFLYWITNFVWDFMFYMGTAIFILPPIAYFHADSLDFNYIQLIFILNILHGYAALPFIYICSFCFDNPGFGFSALAISTFIISSLCCTGAVFMEHYAETLNNVPLVVFIETILQMARLLPSYSYSRGMTKVLQLATENAVCQRGGKDLETACQEKSVAFKMSLLQCCKHIAGPDPYRYAISPLDVHSYSAFYEVLTLFLEGPLLFGLLVYADYYLLRQLDRHLTAPEAENNLRLLVPPAEQGVIGGLSLSKPAVKHHEDTDVVDEDKLVANLVQNPVTPSPIPQALTNQPSKSQTQLQAKQQPKMPSQVPDSMQPAMVVYRLHKAYGYLEGHIVLQGLSFSVRSGECFGLLGVNGAGKTTTFKILTGEILPQEGDAYIGGVSVVRNVYEFQSHLGYCPQSNALLDALTGIETLMLYIRLRGIQITIEYVEALLEIFNLNDIGDHLVGTYSAGNRRKLCLCVSLIGMPRMLLLDEPYSGIGILSRKRIVNYISSLQRRTKISIVLSSHSLADVEFLCNRIAILGDGRLQCLGSLAHLKRKFGQGYTITVKTYPDRKQDILYQRDVAREVRKNFQDVELMHSYEGLLEFRVSRIQMLWSEMFTRMARIKKRFKLQDFYITDTSLEQIFLSVTRKQVSEAAAAALRRTNNPSATSLGI